MTISVIKTAINMGPARPTDQLQIVKNGFIIDFDQLQMQTTNLDYKSLAVLFFTSLLMITSDWQWQQTNKSVSEKHLSINIELKTKFLLQLAF